MKSVDPDFFISEKFLFNSGKKPAGIVCKLRPSRQKGGENRVTATERRQEIMNVLILRRHDTITNLASEFGVCERTIRTDITELSLQYPLETVTGPHGGIRLADWFRPSRKVLTQEQIAAIRKAAPFLEGKDQQALLSILTQFTAP